jgi:hypothetical protein
MARTNTTAAPIVAEICLYGTREHGAGWLASTPDGRMFGDGELNFALGFTQAVWDAGDALAKAGVRSGTIRIFAPGGQRMALVSQAGYLPYYGDLKWEAAPVIEISCEDIERVAAEQAAARGE